MKLYLFILTALYGAGLYAQNPTKVIESRQKDEIMSSILSLSEVGSFIDGIKKIKKGKSPSFSNPYEKELRDDGFIEWKTFPVDEYAAGLKDQFKTQFNIPDLYRAKEFYSDPFKGKILTLLNTKAELHRFMPQLLAGVFKNARASKNKLTLIQSVINLHKINPLIEDQKNKLKNRIKRLRELMEVLENASQTIEAEELRVKERILQEFDGHIIRFYAHALEETREAELRELVRVMKSNKVAQSAGQIFTTYHYFFLDRSFPKAQAPSDQKP